MASKNSELFVSLSRKEIDVLRDKLSSGGTAARFVTGDEGHAHEMHEVGIDLHHAWMAALDREFGK